MTEQPCPDKIGLEKIVSQKQRLRDKIRKILAKQKEKERTEKSRKIKTRLFSSPDFRRAKVVMFYVSREDEVDTRSMIRAALRIGKEVLIPEVKSATGELVASQTVNFDKELIKGHYGIYHPKRKYLRPVKPAKIDLVIVPGLAFDVAGNRLGRGAGYYDRFLKKLTKRSVSIGLAFDFQIVDNLPIHTSDIPVREVLYA